MSGRILTRLALVVLLGVGAGSALRIRAQASAPATAQPKTERRTDYPYPRHLNLSIDSDPLSIISFTLFPGDNGNGSPPWTNYLAVLVDPGELRIFRTTSGGKLATDFSLKSAKTVGWLRLYSFPSDTYPGVIVYGEYDGREYGLLSTDVVCFVHGKFRVVYRGDQADFVDISGLDMPEVIQYTAIKEKDQTGNFDVTRVRLWTWVGMQYKRVIDVPYEDRFSPRVLHAIKAVQEQGKAVTAPPPKAKRP
jgi:hypothetical protein